MTCSHPCLLLTGRARTVRLSSAAINAKVDVSDATPFPVSSCIGMHHLHSLGVSPVQPIAGLDQWPCRIQADDLLQPEVEEVGQIPAHVRTQRVAHAGRPVNTQARVAQEDQTLRDTVGHWLQVVHSGYVARWFGQ